MLDIEKYIPEKDMLKKCIKYLWVLDGKKYSTVNHILIPVTNFELIYNLSSPITYSYETSETTITGTHILGVRNKAITIKQSGIIRLIGVAFHDFTVLPFLKKPVKAYKNKIIETSIDNESEISFLEKLKKTKITKECIPLIENQLYVAANLSLLPPEHILHILMEFRKKKYSENIIQFCNRMNIHHKKLERIFLKYSGISPKQYAMTFRMQRLVNSLVHNKSVRMTDKAYEFDYFDQTHMNKNFKNILNEKPYDVIRTNLTVKSIIKEPVSDFYYF